MPSTATISTWPRRSSPSPTGCGSSSCAARDRQGALDDDDDDDLLVQLQVVSRDIEPPVLRVPAGLAVTATGSNGAVLTYRVHVSDPVDPSAAGRANAADGLAAVDEALLAIDGTKIAANASWSANCTLEQLEVALTETSAAMLAQAKRGSGTTDHPQHPNTAKSYATGSIKGIGAAIAVSATRFGGSGGRISARPALSWCHDYRQRVGRLPNDDIGVFP
jgi:hypothetical protein